MRLYKITILLPFLFSIITQINCQEYRVYTDDQRGFVLSECNETEDEWLDYPEPKLVFDYNSLYILILAIILFLLFLGLKKAILGLCFRPIEKLGLKYIRPFEPYDEIGTCRRFLLNTVFFFLCPFLFCCGFCCRWKDAAITNENDESNEHFIILQTKYTRPNQDDLYDSDQESSSEIEIENLIKNNKKFKKETVQNINEIQRKGAGIVKDFERCLTKIVEVKRSSSQAQLGKPLAPDIDSIQEDEEEEDTSFVLSALTESRDSLKMLDGHYSKPVLDLTDPVNIQANEFVQKLQESKIVYRIFEKPVANIKLSNDNICINYSIRGYFVPLSDTRYQFITNLPLRQYWIPDTQSNSLIPLYPPIVLLSRDFSKIYENKLDVYKFNDLVVKPDITYPCLNIRTQNHTIYKHNEANNFTTNQS